MKGNVFNIQKFSIHDGPGIRTTVFFKGCPLRCQWCANPESQSANIQITYEPQKCQGCRRCINNCPKHCIFYEPNNGAGRIHIDYDKCTACRSCVNSCLPKALRAEGEMMEMEKVLSACLQDIDFYVESKGGVTLSGGECMCQPNFVQALIAELKKYHIHVAAETTGYVKQEIFHHLAPMFDLLLFDVKHYSSDKHFGGTGVHNELIIANLTWAFQQGLNILPRIPVIPGFNATVSDADGIADLLAEIGFQNAQLLPFHQFGERKYELLSKDYFFKDIKALCPEELVDYQQVFFRHGIHACF